MSKHKVFISYHHANDEIYKKEFEEKFWNCFINKSVTEGEYKEDLSSEYIKRLIREDKISDSSVIVVLIGSETYKRKHVDWEIYAGLCKKVGGYSGLIGILLPSYYETFENIHLKGKNKYNISTIPPRLQDNIESKYASIYKWEDTQFKDIYGVYPIQNWIEEAFDRKNNACEKINNSKEQFKYNR